MWFTLIPSPTPPYKYFLIFLFNIKIKNYILPSVPTEEFLFFKIRRNFFLDDFISFVIKSTSINKK